MARTIEVHRVAERRRIYHWPEAQLNFWLFIMIASAATCLGIFASFTNIQNTLEVGIPWLVCLLLSSSVFPILHFTKTKKRRKKPSPKKKIFTKEREREGAGKKKTGSSHLKSQYPLSPSSFFSYS